MRTDYKPPWIFRLKSECRVWIWSSVWIWR